MERFDRPRTASLNRKPPNRWPYKRLAAIGALLVAPGAIIVGLLFWGEKHLTERLEILILNGTVIDGTGSPRRVEALGVREGKIVEVANPSSAEAETVIDAHGLIVAPGLIDVHTHIESNVRGARKEDPLAAPNFLSQGVTTIITGNCGTSANSLSQFFDQLQSAGTAVNIGSLVGHNTVRRQVLGEASRDPSEAELRKMCEIVKRAMNDGALGFSTGLEYAPGIFSDRREIEALAAVAGQYHGLYATHLRDEGNDLFRSLEEALDVGRRANIPIQISHLKSRGRNNWGRASQIIRLLEQARAEGLQVNCDAYPYTASSTSLEILIPKRAREGGTNRLRERLRDPVEKRRIVEEIVSQMRSEGWQDFAFARVAYCQSAPEYNGLTIPEVASLLARNSGNTHSGRAARNDSAGRYEVKLVSDKKDRAVARKDQKQQKAYTAAKGSDQADKKQRKETAKQQERAEPEGEPENAAVPRVTLPLALENQAEAICYLASKGGAQMIYENMSETDVGNIIRLSYCMLGSDSGIRLSGEGKPHPRGYGSAVRFLSLYARDRRTFTLEEAVRKMTSLPAETFGLANRGKLLPGYWADIVVFDPAEVNDRATYERPLQAPDGIVYVMVNGKVSLDHGRLVSSNAGQVIKRQL